MSRIKLTDDQCRLLYLVIRQKIEYVMAEASKKSHGLSCIDEASGVLDDLSMAGLFDTSAINGKYLSPNDSNVQANTEVET